MIAEIICIGTELLMGQVVNTNATYIADNLSQLGVNAYFQTVVGDNVDRIEEAIKIAEKRSDLLIFSGGLGPTQDDVTKQTVANYLNEPLVLDQEALEQIETFFKKTNREMTESNKQQALTFLNGRSFQNKNGHAIGTWIEKGQNSYLLLPGPPKELKLMLEDSVYPFLEVRVGKNRDFIISKTLRFYGIGESTLVNKLNDLIEKQTNPTIAPYAGEHEVTLRITASGNGVEECEKMIKKVTDKIIDRVGDYYYGEGYNNSLVKVVGNLLRDNKKTISAAESLTGGLFQSQMVSIPKSGDFFVGGIVTYHTEIKYQVLGVPERVIKEYGVVSEECAISMAENCLKLFGTDIGISFTGVAGPEPLEGNEAGTVWIGLSFKNKDSVAYKYHFMHNREGNRQRTVMQGLDLLRRSLNNN